MESICSMSGCGRPCHIGKDLCLEHFKEVGDYQYGIDAEIKNKIASKFNPENAAQAQAWLETITGMTFQDTLHESLKSGVVLCTALNVIRPDTIRKINMQDSPFKHRENIENYLNGCKTLGMKEVDLFVTKDLYEGDNLVVVTDNIFALSSAARTHGFAGPFIGVKHADKNVRQFTEAQLAEAKTAVSRQTIGSYGYQDETRNPTLSRQIIQDVSGHKASALPSLLNQGSYGVTPEYTPPLQDKIIKNVDQLAAQRANATAASPYRFCGSCGAARDGDAKFCGSCGGAFK